MWYESPFICQIIIICPACRCTTTTYTGNGKRKVLSLPLPRFSLSDTTTLICLLRLTQPEYTCSTILYSETVHGKETSLYLDEFPCGTRALASLHCPLVPIEWDLMLSPTVMRCVSGPIYIQDPKQIGSFHRLRALVPHNWIDTKQSIGYNPSKFQWMKRLLEILHGE